ncbi:MAG TPA: DAHL domain-containing protein, partial [Archangium sp.]|uniref:DAHL domain-containing protein n=1 Tax=Archangium sp. TaxID=1872627 RepID=UPI002ED82ABF
MSLPSDKPRLSKRSVVLATGALALLSVLFTLGRPMRAGEHDDYRTRMRQLRVSSAELEQDILRGHMGLPRAHGSSEQELAELRAGVAKLRATVPSFLSEQDRRTLNGVLDDYLRALADEEALLARLEEQKSRQAGPEETMATLRLLLDSPASPEAERLINTYLQMYERSVEGAERFRVILFAVSLLLVAFVLAVLMRLAHTGAALNVLNAELERRVEERTSALSSANTELRESEARKAAILESSLDGIISLDEGGRILEFNPAAEHIFRMPRAEALGRDFLSLALAASVKAEQSGVLQRALRADAAPGRATRLELSALRTDGNTFPA